MKIPLLVELIGEPASGKTHLALLFPNPLLIDTTPKKESMVVVKKLYPDDWDKRYKSVNTMAMLRSAVDYGISKGFKTIIFDTSADLQRLATAEWLQEQKKDRVYPIMLYGQIRDRVDELFYKIVKAERNIVCTSQLKDEWVKGERTGRKERDGYKRLNFMADIRLYLKIVEKKDLKTGAIRFVRIAKVLKNRFIDLTDENYIFEIENPDFLKIKDLVLKGGIKEEDLVL